MTQGALIAIDWGTSNRRIYVIASSGELLATEGDDRGVLAIAGLDFAVEVAAIRARFADLPVLCAGMAGSNIGWAQVPYKNCPADLDALAPGLHWIEPGRTAIVPGLCVNSSKRSDVMRGEEVQILGAIAAGLAPPEGLFCQPGTHCKWATVAARSITDFHTTMTGEVFALLRRYSLLAAMIDGEVTDGDAYRDGVAAAGEFNLLGDLFAIRAEGLLNGHRGDDAASYASGLLIGTDVQAQRLDADGIVHLIANDDLATLYTTAIQASGARVEAIDGHVAFVAGMTALWSLAHAE